jgi:predicted acylesterase/phospholipase RssA
MEKIPCTLVLCGGGVKGTFQAGFLTELINSEKYDIQSIYASSIGSILAPIVANKRVDLLKDIFMSINNISDLIEKWPWYYFPRLLKGLHLILFKYGIYKNNKLPDKMWNCLSMDEKINANKICKVVAWNICKKQQCWFGGNDNIDELLIGIKASCNLWLLVPPFKHNNEIYTDGGACYFNPINLLLENKTSNKILFIDTDTRIIEDLKIKPRNAIELMYVLHDNVIDILGQKQIDELKEMYKDQLIIIRPDKNIFKNNMELDKYKMNKFFEAGRKKFFTLNI